MQTVSVKQIIKQRDTEEANIAKILTMHEIQLCIFKKTSAHCYIYLVMFQEI